MKNKIPIARCPNCGRTVLRDKLTVTVRAADESYHGKAMLCGKCKTMLAVIEKPKVARGYVAIPVTSATF